MISPEKIEQRSIYKAAEVCALAEVQPFMLRSWEAEFPDLGVANADGRLRVYRQQDLDKVLRIKELIFVDGLTLGAARRKLQKEPLESESSEAPLFDELVGSEARARLDEVKQGLRAILNLLTEPENGSFAAGSKEPKEEPQLSTESAQRGISKGKTRTRRSRKKA